MQLSLNRRASESNIQAVLLVMYVTYRYVFYRYPLLA